MWSYSVGPSRAAGAAHKRERPDRRQQVTISLGRTLAQKRALFRRIADNLAALGLRREDAWINLVEVPKENWSFGLGEASYAPAQEKIPA